MKNKETYSIELEPSQYEFLENMVEKYGLADADKAVRILVDYARTQDKERDDIFQVIRCLEC